MGCNSIKYVISRSDWEEDDSPFSPWPWETDVKVYPDAPASTLQRLQTISQDEVTDEGTLLIPMQVWKMYKETIDALNANIRRSRAEAYELLWKQFVWTRKSEKGGLQTKIDQLTKQKLFTAAQAELLHEERYLGNAALHEMETPTAQDIEDGLRIVEGLINTIYILPSKAKRLKQRREIKTVRETFK
jgi:hypothetical protein